MTTSDPDSALPARYRLYIDESGDHTYNSLEDPSHRYLALLGVWFGTDHYVTFADDLERFKRDIFGPRPDKPVILHRSDIINRKGPFGVLCDAKKRATFDKGLLQIISSARFRMVCVVIDKQRHQEMYSSPFHPYHYCLAAMLDRYCGWLNYKNAVGDAMAEARGKEENVQLVEAYRRVWESGTLMFRRGHHQRVLTSKDIKIRDKRANIAGLQLADVLAYPVKQACLVARGWIPDPGDVFGKRVMQAAAAKLNRNEASGQVTGYGTVHLPRQ